MARLLHGCLFILQIRPWYWTWKAFLSIKNYFFQHHNITITVKGESETCRFLKSPYLELPRSLLLTSFSRLAALRLVFTGNGVRLGVVVEVLRELMTQWKSKIGVASVISSTESESEEWERFHFLSDSVYDCVAYDPVKTRLSETEAEAEEPANRKAQSRRLSLVYSSASACMTLRRRHVTIIKCKL